MICINIASLTRQLIWNSLPNLVVLAESTNSFKSRLDHHWKNQEIIYNSQSQITRTRSQSEISSII